MHSQQGSMAEWLGTGLQNRLLQFESGWDLKRMLRHPFLIPHRNHPPCPSLYRDSGYFRLAGACHEYSVASLNMKNFTSPTPRNCVRKALIFALNDSAEALVSLSSK